MTNSNSFANLDSRDEIFLGLIVALIPMLALAGLLA